MRELMKNYIKYTDFSEGYLLNLKHNLCKKLDDDVEKIITPYINFKTKDDFIKKVPSILQMIYAIGNRFNKLNNLKINSSIDNFLKNAALTNFYSIYEYPPKFSITILPLGFKFLPTNRFLDNQNASLFPDNPKRIKLDVKSCLPTAESEYLNYLNFIDSKGFIVKNNDINRFSVIDHQIKKFLINNSFIQDILIELLISENARRNPSYKYDSIKLTNTYGLPNDFDIEACINRLKKYELPFSPPNMIDKSKIVIEAPGKDIKIFFIAYKMYLDMFKSQIKKNISCTYQNIRSFSEKIKKETDNNLENMYLFEAITSVNHCIHIFYHLKNMHPDEELFCFIDLFYNFISKFPNKCTRVYLIDEILCLLDSDSCNTDNFRDFYYLEEYHDLYQEKYQIMSDFTFYYLNKIKIEYNSSNFSFSDIINLLFKEIQNKQLPWTLNIDGLFIESESNRFANTHFAGDMHSKDKDTNFFKIILRELLIMNRIND